MLWDTVRTLWEAVAGLPRPQTEAQRPNAASIDPCAASSCATVMSREAQVSGLHWIPPQPMAAQRKAQKPRPYLDFLLSGGHNALPHEQAIIFKKLGIFFSIFFTLVNEEFY